MIPFPVPKSACRAALFKRCCLATRQLSGVLLPRAVMRSLLDAAREHNKGMEAARNYRPFVVNGTIFGYVSPSDCLLLKKYQHTFEIKDGDTPSVSLARRLEEATVQERTAAVGAAMSDLRARGGLTQWYDELFPVVNSFSAEPVLLLERAAYSLFGIRGYGVNVHGFVRRDDGLPEMWVAQRSAKRRSFPSMYDCLAGGGQPFGISVEENLVKECLEEASVPAAVSRGARPVGAVSYVTLDVCDRLRRDTLFTFDLELPDTFIPTPADGEVENFRLRSLDWVVSELICRRDAPGEETSSPGFCMNITIIDFLVRHGYLSSDSPMYLDLLDVLNGRHNN